MPWVHKVIVTAGSLGWASRLHLGDYHRDVVQAAGFVCGFDKRPRSYLRRVRG